MFLGTLKYIMQAQSKANLNYKKPNDYLLKMHFEEMFFLFKGTLMQI